jgi:hypothetical protein
MLHLLLLLLHHRHSLLLLLHHRHSLLLLLHHRHSLLLLNYQLLPPLLPLLILELTAH